MNIFKDRDSFYGCPDSRLGADSLLPLFKLAKQIRLRLGRRGYLLDHYLSLFFDGISSNVPSDATLQGIGTGGEIQKLFYQVMDGTEPANQHPLHQRIREVYEQQKDSLTFQEKHTNFCLLLFPLADEIMDYYTSLFIRELRIQSVGVDDMVRFQDLYNQISQMAGESYMDELNKQLQRRFLIVPIAQSFAQGLTYDLLYQLTARDPETSKQLFQLMLDAMPESGEESST